MTFGDKLHCHPAAVSKPPPIPRGRHTNVSSKPKPLLDSPTLRVGLFKDEVTVQPKVTRLSHETTVKLVPSRHLLEHRSVTLDLSAIKSADPFGLVYLAIYVGRLIEYTPLRLSINVGRGEFARYLNRMGVLDVLRRDTRVRVESGTILPEIFGKGSNPRILELEQHTVADEDAAEALSERLLDIIVLKRRRDLLARSELLQTALLEIIANVSVHSGARQVYVAAAAVKDRVHLAIGDAGMAYRRD